MSISSDEINFLIYRYLQENGFTHSAFTFAYESLVAKSAVSQINLPPGALITFIQKGLEYISIEEHINEVNLFRAFSKPTLVQDGTIRDFDDNFSLLSPFICDSIGTKEDKRIKNFNYSGSVPMDEAVMENSDANQSNSNQDTMDIAATSSSVVIRHEEKTKLLNLNGHQGEVFMCTWNPTRKQVASGSADGMCRLWDVDDITTENWNLPSNTELKLRTAVLPHSETLGEKYKDITSVTWSSDGQFLATGCYDGTARIWDCHGNLKTLLREHTGPVFSLKWSKGGSHILSGSYDRRAIVWSADTGAVYKTFLLHTGPVLDVDWRDRDGTMFATCSSDMSINICKLDSTENLAYKNFVGHTDEVNIICWSPNGDYLASCSDDTTAKIWSPEEGLMFDLKGHVKEIYTVRWTPTGPGTTNEHLALRLCTASFDGTVKVWSALNGQIVHNLRRQSQPVYSVAPSPSGEILATGSLGGHVSVWKLDDASLIAELQGNGDTFDVSWNSDGSLLCACFSSGTLYVIDSESLTNNDMTTTDHSVSDIVKIEPPPTEEPMDLPLS